MKGMCAALPVLSFDCFLWLRRLLRNRRSLYACLGMQATPLNPLDRVEICLQEAE